MNTWSADQIVPPISQHAEGPLWDERSGTLLWVDQYLGLVRSARPDGDRFRLGKQWPVGELIGAVVPRAEGGWLVAGGPGFLMLGADGLTMAVASVLPDPTVKPRMRMNDGKVDPLGRFWAGSMTLDKIPGSGALHLLAQGRMRTVLRGQTIPNGMAWTPDGGILYYIDTPERAVRRFRITGETELIDDGIAVRIAEGHGNPDGMCIDDEGMLWVALWGGRAVQRYRPDGQLIGRVDVPAAQVSSCAFGGADRGTLFITTSRENYSTAQRAADPEAGAIFAVRPGVSGPTAAAYAD